MPTNRKYKRLEITEVFLPRFAALSGKRYYPSLRLYRQRYRVHITPFITMSIKILTTSTVAGLGSSARNDVISTGCGTGAQNFSGASLGFHRAYADCTSYGTGPAQIELRP